MSNLIISPCKCPRICKPPLFRVRLQLLLIADRHFLCQRTKFDDWQTFYLSNEENALLLTDTFSVSLTPSLNNFQILPFSISLTEKMSTIESFNHLGPLRQEFCLSVKEIYMHWPAFSLSIKEIYLHWQVLRLSLDVYIYIYRERDNFTTISCLFMSMRERERERDVQREGEMSPPFWCLSDREVHNQLFGKWGLLGLWHPG